MCCSNVYLSCIYYFSLGQQLLKLWMESEHQKEGNDVILSVIDRASATCQSSRQIAMLLRVITDLVISSRGLFSCHSRPSDLSDFARVTGA